MLCMRMVKMQLITNDDLLRKYCDEKLSLRAIAKQYGTTHGTIKKKLIELGVEIRPFNSSEYYNGRNKREVDGEWIVDSLGYKAKGGIREHRKIAGKTKYDGTNIHHIDFNKLNNSPNNLYEFESVSVHQMYHAYVKKNGYLSPDDFVRYYNENILKTVENRDWLYEHYIVQKMSANAISKKIGVSRKTVTNRLKSENIWELRTPTIN